MVRKKYTIKQELVARFANALANPARVAICEFLSLQGACYFGAIQEKLPLAKATVSQHLTVLKDAELIQSEVLTPRVKYSIDKENWQLAKDVLYQFMSSCIKELSDDETAETCCSDEPTSERE